MGVRRLDSLTSLRGLAALAVVLFHATLAFAPGGALAHATRLFPIMVSFFFMLSGFVLAWNWVNERPVFSFLRDRAARILPIYLLTWLLAVASLSWLRWAPSATEMLTSLVLLQAWVPGSDFAVAVNVPAWSLSCEVAFYACLPFAARHIAGLDDARLRRTTGGLILWMICGLSIAMMLPVLWWPGVRAAEFLLGVALATGVRRGLRIGRSAAVCGCASASVLVGLTASRASIGQGLSTMLAAPALMALIVWAAGRDVDRRPTHLTHPLLSELGRVSYSVYLVHWLVVVILSRFLLGSGWILVGLLASYAIAYCMNRTVETPLYRRLRSPMQPQTRSALVPLTAYQIREANL
jgi:peptidoglycan/LPS O-acetylase OafA/YrhL